MRFRFILSQTFRGLWANKAMAASVALVTFVSLLFVGAASLLQTQVSNLKGDWYDKVEVSVFMCPSNSTAPQCASGEATEQQIADIQDFLETDEISQYIETIHFETKAEAQAANAASAAAKIRRAGLAERFALQIEGLA